MAPLTNLYFCCVHDTLFLGNKDGVQPMLKSDKTVDGFLISSLTSGSEKRVELICDECGRLTSTTFSNYSRGIAKRGGGTETYCKPCATRAAGKLKRGKPIRCTGPRPKVHADKHHSWRGGRFVASDGYVKVYLGPKTYRKEHFLVMEESLGRDLRQGEVVHHVDTDKVNNAIGNLVLLAGEREHQRVHESLRRVVASVLKAGLIGFDRESNSYEAVGKLRELLGQPEEANQQPSRGGDAPEGSTTRGESP